MSLQPSSQADHTPDERRPDWRNWVITILVILTILALVLIQQFFFSD